MTKKKYRLRRNRKSSITRRRTNKKHSLRRYTKSKKKSLKKSRNKRRGSLGDKAVPDRDPQPMVGGDIDSDKAKANSIYDNNKKELDSLGHEDSREIDGIRFEKYSFFNYVDLTGYNKNNEKVFHKEYPHLGPGCYVPF